MCDWMNEWLNKWISEWTDQPGTDGGSSPTKLWVQCSKAMMVIFGWQSLLAQVPLMNDHNNGHNLISSHVKLVVYSQNLGCNCTLCSCLEPRNSHCKITLKLKPKTRPWASGRHLPYGITQCYLSPDTSEHAPPYLSQYAGTRFTYPGGMEGWVDLG